MRNALRNKIIYNKNQLSLIIVLKNPIDGIFIAFIIIIIREYTLPL